MLKWVALGALALAFAGCTASEELFGTAPPGVGPGCGDGVIGDGEACDGENLDDQTCADVGFSSEAGLACSATCTLDATGCKPSCDGVALEPGEECDGTAFDGMDCTDFGFATAAGLVCSGCAIDTSGCMASCDGVSLEPEEPCDGTFLDDMDCTDFGYSNAAGLACTACAFDTTGCQSSCNGALVEPGEECDGDDLNGHDCTELGFGSPAGMVCTGCFVDGNGCAAECGNSVPEPGEECDDGNDDPTDACDDCTNTGTTCGNAIPVALALGAIKLTGSTEDGGQHESDQCSNEDTSADRVYAITPQESGFFTAVLDRAETDYDSKLYALSDCLDVASGILCADSFDVGGSTLLTGGEVLSFQVEAFTTYFLIVDGFDGDEGDYALTLDLSAGNCADPIPFPIWDGQPMPALGGIDGEGNDGSSVMGGTCGGTMSEDVVYEITPQLTGTLTLSIPSADYNSTIYVRTTCATQASELICNHTNPFGGESVMVSATSGVPLYFWVDGFAGSEGSYRASVSPF